MQGGRLKKQSGKDGKRRGSTMGAVGGPTLMRTNSVSYRHVGKNFSDPLGEAMETSGMRREEEEQRSHQDAFWGIDKESFDRERDREHMKREHALSTMHEMQHKAKQQQLEWERSYQQMRHDEAYHNAVKEMQTRRNYMSSLFAAGTSQEVMKYVWNPETHVLPFSKAQIVTGTGVSPRGRPFGTSQQPQQLQVHQKRVVGGNRLNDLTESMSGAESFVKQIMGGSTFELPPLDHEYRNHLHLDGLQQSKALASGQIQQGLGASLRNRSSAAGVAEAAMSSARKPLSTKQSLDKNLSISMGGGVFVTPLSEVGGGNGNNSSNIIPTKMTFKLTTSKGKSTILPPPLSRKHIPALDGHPKMGWDQHSLLNAAFELLDTSRTGRLTMENVSQIAKNSEVQSFLRYTVLGSLVKRKRWDSFRSIFPYEEGYIGISEWLSAANAAAIESRVTLRSIRTEEAHVKIVNALQSSESGEIGWQWLVSTSSIDGVSKKKSNGWFAEHARNHLHRVGNYAILKRSFVSGDVVWALHGGGVVWLQAVIERVNEDGTYDLTYPLTPTTTSRLREVSLTRKLVESSIPKNKGNNRVGDRTLPQGELANLIDKECGQTTDLQICGRVFDVFFGDRAPVQVPIQLLVSGLYNPSNGIRSVVEGNIILNAIAPKMSQDAMENITKALTNSVMSNPSSLPNGGMRVDLFPPLAVALCEAFMAQDGKSKVGECVSKAEFLAFCNLVGERISLSQ